MGSGAAGNPGPHRLLVTGAAGFIGTNFVRYWRRAHPSDRIVALDALTYAGNRANLPADGIPGFRFVHGDIRDEKLVVRLLREEGIDCLVHFAAESHVDRSIHGPDPFVETNIVGTHALLKAARAVWLDRPGGPAAHRFHHVSTDEVYGSLGPYDPPFRETTPFAPNSPYAASKAAADHLARAYHRTYGLQVTISNCPNNYGPYQFPEKLIPLMIVNLLRGEPLPVYGDGGNLRDWLHVEDHCRALDLVLAAGKVGETYCIGAGNERTNIETVTLLCDLMDEAFATDPSLNRRFPAAPPVRNRSCRSAIASVADRPGHDRRYAVDGRKIAAELGFAPRHGFEAGLRATVNWYLAHEAWWRAVMDGSYRDWIARNYGT